jgi:hypothetical protein
MFDCIPSEIAYKVAANKLQLNSNEGDAGDMQIDHSLFNFGVAAGEQKEDENIAHHMTSSAEAQTWIFERLFRGVKNLIYRAK